MNYSGSTTGCMRKGHPWAPVAVGLFILMAAAPLQAMQNRSGTGQTGRGESAAGTDEASTKEEGTVNWWDLPEGDRVVLKEAIFDNGGYQLVPRSGKTVLVPFVNKSQYAMRFARSDDDTSYVVNDGSSAPVLYMAQDHYLESAAGDNTKWYPLTSQLSNNNTPVYVGLAPSYDAYRNMGWFPGMVVQGGMYGTNPTGVFNWMPGYGVNVNGYTMSYPVYSSYYVQNRTAAVQNRPVSSPFQASLLAWTVKYRSNQITGAATNSTASTRSSSLAGAINQKPVQINQGQRQTMAPPTPPAAQNPFHGQGIAGAKKGKRAAPKLTIGKKK